MKKIFITLTCLFFINILIGQEIKMGINILGYKFEQNDNRLSWKQLISATESNLEANLLIRKAKTQKVVSSILSFSGGFLTGIPIGQSIRNENPNWTLAYIGGAVFIVSIPIGLKALKNVRQGIDSYNSSLNSTANDFQPEYNLIVNSNGIGLSMKF